MKIAKNKTILDRINIKELQGASPGELKEDYVKLNCFNIDDIDAPIFRIVQLQNFLDDVERGCLTHMKAHKETWSDDLENPFLDWKYKLETGEFLTLNGILQHYYALAWTCSKNEKLEHWTDFSHGKPSVRISTTPRKLLHRLMNAKDRYFMLHHFIGAVEYREEGEIREWVKNSWFEGLLDSLGQQLAMSLMVLNNVHAFEAEVRLVYAHTPHDDNNWVQRNVQFTPLWCKVPFKWNDIVDEVLLGPYVSCVIKNSY